MKIKPYNDFNASNADSFREALQILKAGEYNGYLHLDLSDVEFMDTTAFRCVFDYISMFITIIPPRDKWVLETYNQWLDSKKGLSK